MNNRWQGFKFEGRIFCITTRRSSDKSRVDWFHSIPSNVEDCHVGSNEFDMVQSSDALRPKFKIRTWSGASEVFVHISTFSSGFGLFTYLGLLDIPCRLIPSQGLCQFYSWNPTMRKVQETKRVPGEDCTSEMRGNVTSGSNLFSRRAEMAP